MQGKVFFMYYKSDYFFMQSKLLFTICKYIAWATTYFHTVNEFCRSFNQASALSKTINY